MNSSNSCVGEPKQEENRGQDDDLVIDNGFLYMNGNKMVYYGKLTNEDEEQNVQDEQSEKWQGGVIEEGPEGMQYNTLQHLDFKEIIKDPEEMAQVSQVSRTSMI